MSDINSILIKTLEVTILFSTVLLAITRFTADMEQDDYAIGITNKAIYISLFFTSISAVGAGSYLYLRLISGEGVIDAFSLSLVFIPLIIGLVFLVYTVMALLSDYGSTLGLR